MRPRVSTSTNIFCVSLYKFELQISTSTYMYATIFTWDYVIDVYNFIDGNIFVVELMEV